MSIVENAKAATLSRTEDFVKNLQSGGLNFLARGPVDTQMRFPEQDFMFRKQNNSYSGTDCTVVAIYNQNLIVLGNIETFSYSLFREKNPVRTLGRIYPKGYTLGQRSCAGSIVFITFDQHPLYSLFNFFNERTDSTHRFSSPLSDDIPPFDIMLIFGNEYGAKSIIRLYGVELFQEGGVFSINDIYSECTVEYLAKDMDPMISAGEEGSWKSLLYRKMTEGKIIDDHFASMLKYRQKLEREIADIDRKIDEYTREGRGNVNLTYGSTNRLARKVDRLDNREKASQLQILRTSIVKELQRLDASINAYEKTKMSWDMNTSMQTVDKITLSKKDVKNVTDPSPVNGV